MMILPIALVFSMQWGRSQVVVSTVFYDMPVGLLLQVMPVPTNQSLSYQLQGGASLEAWPSLNNWTNGTGQTSEHTLALADRGFYRLAYRPQAMSVAAPEHTGFFRSYQDFILE